MTPFQNTEEEKLSMEKLLKLNLQFFADGGEDESGEEPDKNPIVDGEETTPEKTFTQADLDELAAKVRREEKAKQERKAEQQREEQRKAKLEEDEEYKELLEETKKELERYKMKEKERERLESINGLLIEKGFTDEQVRRYSKYVSGETDEQIEESIESVYQDFVVSNESKKVDPSAGFGDSKKSKELSDEDYGRELLKQIRK